MNRNKKKGHRKAGDYRRPIETRSKGKSILIVTEGEVTEKKYFEALCRKLDLKASRVKVVHPEGTDPITLTKAAISLRKAREKEAKRSPVLVPFKEVWVVFDLEQQHDERRVQAKKAQGIGGKGIKFIESDPSFEYWRLLHEEDCYTTKFFPDKKAVITELSKKLGYKYDSNEAPTVETLNKIPIAVKHAQRCRKYHEDSGGNTNPSTNVDLLVRSMNEASIPTRQLDLPAK